MRSWRSTHRAASAGRLGAARTTQLSPSLPARWVRSRAASAPCRRASRARRAARAVLRLPGLPEDHQRAAAHGGPHPGSDIAGAMTDAALRRKLRIASGGRLEAPGEGVASPRRRRGLSGLEPPASRRSRVSPGGRGILRLLRGERPVELDGSLQPHRQPSQLGLLRRDEPDGLTLDLDEHHLSAPGADGGQLGLRRPATTVGSGQVDFAAPRQSLGLSDPLLRTRKPLHPPTQRERRYPRSPGAR